jgi:hypothetical protein
MVIANGETPDGTKALIIGLSHTNVALLLQGNPIRCTHQSHPVIPEGQMLLILAGQTEDSIVADLREFCAGDFEAVDHRNTPGREDHR